MQTLSSPIRKLSACVVLLALTGANAFGQEEVARASSESEATPAATDESTTSPEQVEEKEPEPSQDVLAYEDRLRLRLPARWKRVEPRNRMIEVEFAVPPEEENEDVPEEERVRGRLTMSSAGGSVDANMRRWIGQFRLGRDADGQDALRRDAVKLRGAIAHKLDIAGTFFDSPRGPFGPKTERPDYRMLGAIVEVEGAGRYFIKFYGPQELVEANAEAFEEMVASLESNSGESTEEHAATKEEPQS